MTSRNKYVFAIHRGGSSVLGGVTKACAKASGDSSVMLGSGDKAFRETGRDGAAVRGRGVDVSLDSEMPSISFVPNVQNWQARTGVFAPIRRADFFPAEVFRAGTDLALLNIRDPRDCMVSGYFGFLRLHGEGLKDPKRQRQYDMGIDAYVVEILLDRYIGACRDFVALKEKIGNLHILKYEEMVTSFPTWFRKFYTLLEFSEPKFGKLMAQQAVKFEPPQQEDIDSHKRQMLPGDYARKLKPETIRHINSRMAAELAFFGYT